MRKIREIPVPIHHLLAWRRLRGYSQEQLAERAGLSHATISRLENGVSDLTRSTATLLAAALKIEILDLFRDPSDRNGVWAIAHRVAALPPDRREIIKRFLDSLASEEDAGAS